MKEVLLLSKCDAVHSRDSFRTVGIFSTHKKLINYLKAQDGTLTEQDIRLLSLIAQTQGKDENYIIDYFNINNPKN